MTREFVFGASLLAAATSVWAQVPPPDPSAAEVPQGYRVEVVLKDLTYPTSVEFDRDGNMYVAEGGYSYGDPDAVPRILKITRAGAVSTAASDGLHGPVADLLYHDGRLYVAHRGRISVLEDGGLRDLVTGLPSEGDHHTNQMAVGPDGKIYFGQGTATNAGVVGPDNAEMGWLKQHPDVHDVPAQAITLRQRTFASKNPLSAGDAQASTGAFQPFGEPVPDNGTVPGATKANGTILRMNADGSGLEVYAWGLRNPFGVMWRGDKLYASENGFDVRGSRPVANDKEDVYEIKQGAWYGWPDFASGIPVTDARFKPKEGPAPAFVMAKHPPVEKPLITFPEHSAAAKLAVSPGGFGDKGDLFLAFFGHMAPMTGTVSGEHGGHRVVRLNPDTKQTETFFSQKGHHGSGTSAKSAEAGHGGQTGKDESISAGPRRLVDVVFSQDGQAMYVVDFGAMVVEEQPKPFPGSGVVWRITRVGTKLEGAPTNLAVPRPDGL